jgi:hypothetical protein
VHIARLYLGIPLLAVSLMLYTGASTMADDTPSLPAGVDVPVSLLQNGAASFSLPALNSGSLTVGLQSGDVQVSFQNQDQTNVSSSSMAGSGTATMSFQTSSAGQPLQLGLTSAGGAQLILHLTQDASIGPNSASTSSVSTSSSSTVVSSSSISIINRQVTVSGGGTS